MSILNSITKSAYFPSALLFPFFLSIFFFFFFLSLFLFVLCVCAWWGEVVIWDEEVNLCPFLRCIRKFSSFQGHLKQKVHK